MDEGPIRSKHLNLVIVRIGNEEVAIRTECKSGGEIELAGEAELVSKSPRDAI